MAARMPCWSSAYVVVLCLAAGALISPARTPAAEFRGFWAEVFDPGFKNASDINAMISRAVQGRYNVIIPEILAYQDGGSSSHGAYWNSSILPKAPDITPSGFDPLAYLVQQAHANGIEVHPWLVTYRISLTWPPAGNTILQAHPEWCMVPQANMGGGPAKVDGYYVLDPGSPDVQEYLVSIVRELVTNYAIDGIHWDYIRYTVTDAGYPANTSYANSGLARFKRITGYAGTPPPTGYTPWDDFRRREITELVRRVRAEIPSMNNPRQPVRQSAALITWGSAPSNFQNSSAWARFQNWEEWMRLGYLDTGIPMTYYDYSVYPSYYTSWVDRSMTWRYQRQMVVGPALYLNTFENSLIELQYARSKGANGVCTYNYYSTKKPSVTDWTWYTYVATNFFTTPDTVPTMPWRNPATATEGTLWGRVTDADTGQPIDDASVTVSGMSTVKTDGNGYYVVTLIPATAAGTYYTVTMARAGYAPVIHYNVLVVAGEARRHNFGDVPPPTITQHPSPQSVCPGATATFTVVATGEGTLAYAWQRNGVFLSNGGHYSGVNTPTLTVSSADDADVGNYACVVSNGGGGTGSNPAALTVRAATAISQQPADKAVYRGDDATFVVGATGDGTLTYRWQKGGVDLSDDGHYSGTSTSTLTILAALPPDAGVYRCVVGGGCGTVTSNEASLTVKPMIGDLDQDGDVDLTDFAMFQSCFNGPNRPPAPACAGSADFNGDGDVDLADFTVMQLCFGGPNQPPSPGCPKP